MSFRLPRKLAPSLLLWLAGCQTTFPVVQPSNSPAAPQRLQCLAPLKPMTRLQAHSQPDGFPSAQCVTRARSLVSKMNLDQKLGQMMQPNKARLHDVSDVSKYGFGSILSGGGAGPTMNTPLAWAKMVNSYRSESLKNGANIPMLYGVDAVHGHNNVYGAVIYPHNIGLGASRSPDLVERIGQATAKAVRGTNIGWTFSPVLAAARDERWGRTYEAFGETPELAELLGPAMIRGLQGPRLGRSPDSVLACAKHFIGDGNTVGGQDQGDVTQDAQALTEQMLRAYKKAIDAGVGSVMASFSSVQGVKMHCHGPLLNDTLKGELGFQGFVVSDWQAIEQLPGPYSQQLEASITAGVDMVMEPKGYTHFIKAMKELVPARIPMDRIDDAVARILTVKCELGHLDSGAFRRDRSGGLAISDHIGTIGSDAHRNLARRAVSESLVLLKNDGALPLSRQGPQTVLVAGSHADDIGLQSGGWTITWQGNPGAITQGTTILAALEARAALPHPTSQGATAQPSAVISHSPEGSGAQGSNVALLVIGERPYAEGKGDDPDLAISPQNHQLAKRLKASAEKLVVVLLSGRPLILGSLVDTADAIVAAWLPGSEGAGIADVLFGDRDFVGVLPHSWPRELAQVPINVGDADYDPLYPYGFGLSYAGPLTSETPPQPTTPDTTAVPSAAAPADTLPNATAKPPTSAAPLPTVTPLTAPTP